MTLRGDGCGLWFRRRLFRREEQRPHSVRQPRENGDADQELRAIGSGPVAAIAERLEYRVDVRAASRTDVIRGRAPAPERIVDSAHW